MSWLACLTAFLVSVLPSVPGFRASIEAPRLIPFKPVPVPAGQVDVVTGLRVMSQASLLKSIPRLSATWTAATHWPRFLKLASLTT